MPYETLQDLPKSVSDVLPNHAQEIYQAAFNNAWDQYADPEDRQGDDSREQVAHKVAWLAVKQTYKKENGNWQKKNKKPDRSLPSYTHHLLEIYSVSPI